MTQPFATDAHHIALFIPSLGAGGAERVFIRFANLLSAAGHRVDLVVGSTEGELAREVAPGVEVVDLGGVRMRGAIRTLAAYLAEHRPDALISTIAHTNLVAMLAGRLSRSGVPVAVRVSNTYSQPSKLSETPADKVVVFSLKHLYRRARMVIAPSQGAADDLEVAAKVPRSRLRVVTNPVIGDDFWDLSAEAVDHRWFAPGAPPVILGLGRLHHVKNFSGLIDAFATVRRGLDCRLMILGEGGEREALEARIDALGLADDVELPGFDPNPFRFLRAASLFVLSSSTEGLPGALIQAIAVGTPVVSTDCPSGPDEVLQGGRFGSLVPVGDTSALAAAMAATLREPPAPPGPEAWQRYTDAAAAADLVAAIDELTSG